MKQNFISAVFASVASNSAKQGKAAATIQPKKFKTAPASGPSLASFPSLPRDDDNNNYKKKQQQLPDDATGWVTVVSKKAKKNPLPSGFSAKAGGADNKDKNSQQTADKNSQKSSSKATASVVSKPKKAASAAKPTPSFLGIMGYGQQDKTKQAKVGAGKQKQSAVGATTSGNKKFALGAKFAPLASSKTQQEKGKDDAPKTFGTVVSTIQDGDLSVAKAGIVQESNDLPVEKKGYDQAADGNEGTGATGRPCFLMSVPYEIFTGGILSYLRPEDMMSLGACSRWSKNMTQDGFLWQTMFRQRFPASQLSPQAMEEWRLAYQLTLTMVVKRLKCFHTQQTFFEDTLGVGLDYTINPKTRVVDYISLSQDLISQTAFQRDKIRTDAFGNKSKLFLPLYFSESHFQRALPRIQKTVAHLCPEQRRLAGGSFAFQPSMVLDVFPKIVTTFVVLLSDEGVSASKKSFTGLVRIHRLFLALAHQFPSIKKEALQRLRRFVAGKEHRSKKACPSLGDILPLLMVVDEQDFDWRKIRATYLEEKFDRSVLWVCKDHPFLEKTGQETPEEAETRIKLTRVSMTVQLRLTMFYVSFLDACCQGTTTDRANKYDCFFGQPEPDDKTPEPAHTGSEQNETKAAASTSSSPVKPADGLSFSHFRQQVNLIHTSTGWQDFFHFVGLRGPSNKEAMAQLLRRHVANSRRKKYHTAGMDFGRVQASGTSKILSKGQKYSASSGLRHVIFFDTWNFDASHGTKYLDASCLVYRGKERVETVDYSNIFGQDGAIIHSGDEMRQDGGTHTIQIDLSRLRPDVTSLVFVISAWAGAKLSEILSPSISFSDADEEDAAPLCVYELDSHDKIDHLTSVIMCKLYRTRDGNSWHVQAIGDAYRGYAGQYGPIYEAVQALL